LQLAQNRYNIVANSQKETIKISVILGGNALNPLVLLILEKNKQLIIYEGATGKIVQTI